MKSTTKTLHPLIQYMRNWEAFNSAARKTDYRWFYVFIGMLFLGFLVDVIL